jgi:hypothetical protein
MTIQTAVIIKRPVAVNQAQRRAERFTATHTVVSAMAAAAGHVTRRAAGENAPTTRSAVRQIPYRMIRCRVRSSMWDKADQPPKHSEFRIFTTYPEVRLE